MSRARARGYALAVLRLYGTLTSPYVRRVRVVALELGLDHELVDTTSDAGQAELRARSPLWKVPTAVIDGRVVFDSRVICRRLIEAAGAGASIGLPAADDVEAENLITVVDGALDALINCFYLGRDGVEPEPASYLQKQQQRAAASMAWIDERVAARPASAGFGLVELALCTTAEWMRFRDTYAFERHPAIVALVERHAARPSLAQTRPPA